MSELVNANFICDKCESGFYYAEWSELRKGERPRCPYCGSFDTRELS